MPPQRPVSTFSSTFRHATACGKCCKNYCVVLTINLQNCTGDIGRNRSIDKGCSACNIFEDGAAETQTPWQHEFASVDGRQCGLDVAVWSSGDELQSCMGLGNDGGSSRHLETYLSQKSSDTTTLRPTGDGRCEVRQFHSYLLSLRNCVLQGIVRKRAIALVAEQGCFQRQL